jgi:hypothetical protein
VLEFGMQHKQDAAMCNENQLCRAPCKKGLATLLLKICLQVWCCHVGIVGNQAIGQLTDMTESDEVSTQGTTPVVTGFMVTCFKITYSFRVYAMFAAQSCQACLLSTLNAYTTRISC